MFSMDSSKVIVLRRSYGRIESVAISVFMCANSLRCVRVGLKQDNVDKEFRVDCCLIFHIRNHGRDINLHHTLSTLKQDWVVSVVRFTHPTLFLPPDRASDQNIGVVRPTN